MTEEQKQQIAQVLIVGCPLETAADLVSEPIETVHRAIDSDPEFADLVLRNAAGAELKHVQNIKSASNNEKNWRASVWWLERRAPEKYARRDSECVTEAQFNRFVDEVVELIAEEIRESEVLEKIIARMDKLINPDEAH